VAFIVGDGCIRCKYTDCVDVCPVEDCFRVGPNFLVIDPVTCIDCTLCVPECPAEAIFAEKDVPEDQQEFIALNAELAKVWPGINDPIDPLEDADDWVDEKAKLQYLER
jgi:ferredoxin